MRNARHHFAGPPWWGEPLRLPNFSLAGAFVLLLALLALTPLSTGGAADGGRITGPATVIDASHLEVAGRRVKIYGIDAPDPDQTCEDREGKDYPCGIEARRTLARIVQGEEVSCQPRGPNQLNETLATCSTGQTDLAQALVTTGWALADRPRTLDYEEDELKARTAKLGLWQGAFLSPAEWRNGERVAPKKRGGGLLGPGGLF